MTPRRKQTNISSGQPVRLYKFIALTFLLLTVVLLGVVVFMSSKRAVITIETRASKIDTSTSLVLGGATNADVPGKLSTILVSKTKTFQPTGTKEEPGIAKGMVTLHNDGSVDQPLVVKTRLVTENDILYRLSDRVNVPAGGTVQVEVYADVAGPAGDIEPSRFTIPGLNEAKQKIIYATSEEWFTGGTKVIGVLSIDDIKKAEKTLLAELEEEGMAQLKNEEGVDQLKNQDKRPAVFKVVDQTFETKSEIGTEVSEFDLSGQVTLLGVFYDEDVLNSVARDQLNKRAVDDTELIEPGADKPTLSLDSHDLEKGTATVSLFYNGSAILNPDSQQLDKNIFYGKSRDEVRRYVLSLDHVRGVEVKFSPAWMQSVPHIADHVQIVVKNVE